MILAAGVVKLSPRPAGMEKEVFSVDLKIFDTAESCIAQDLLFSPLQSTFLLNLWHDSDSCWKIPTIVKYS